MLSTSLSCLTIGKAFDKFRARCLTYIWFGDRLIPRLYMFDSQEARVAGKENETSNLKKKANVRTPIRARHLSYFDHIRIVVVQIGVCKSASKSKRDFTFGSFDDCYMFVQNCRILESQGRREGGGQQAQRQSEGMNSDKSTTLDIQQTALSFVHIRIVFFALGVFISAPSSLRDVTLTSFDDCYLFV